MNVYQSDDARPTSSDYGNHRALHYNSIFYVHVNVTIVAAPCVPRLPQLEVGHGNGDQRVICTSGCSSTSKALIHKSIFVLNTRCSYNAESRPALRWILCHITIIENHGARDKHRAGRESDGDW